MPADLARLAALARENGARSAVVIPVSEVVVDPRVRLKCLVPRCVHYGVNLMCPPNVPGPEEFAVALACYRHAILVQMDLPLPPAVIGSDLELAEVYESGVYVEALTLAGRRLASVLRRMEAEALRLGYPLAAGFGAGACRLCDQCVGVSSGRPCRLAFKARPAMEAVGIDVVRTAARAGVAIYFDDPTKATWTGLVLVD